MCVEEGGCLSFAQSEVCVQVVIRLLTVTPLHMAQASGTLPHRTPSLRPGSITEQSIHSEIALRAFRGRALPLPWVTSLAAF